MPQIVILPSATAGLAAKDIGLTPATDALEIRLTNTAHNASFTQLSDLTVVADNFADNTLPITNSGNNIEGDNKQDSVIADKDFVSVGNPTGPFINIYIIDTTSNAIVGYSTFGSAQTVPAGDALQFRPNSTANVVFQINIA